MKGKQIYLIHTNCTLLSVHSILNCLNLIFKQNRFYLYKKWHFKAKDECYLNSNHIGAPKHIMGERGGVGRKSSSFIFVKH